ncbi:hypothetical protein [Nocardia sp. NPDC004860]|uniref:hypothetical protein n=1 Tax=Nocardia sp. NPDC004860 TaxID=3154557 RepID=UPI0033BDB901
MTVAEPNGQWWIGDCASTPKRLTADTAHRIMQLHAHWSGTPCALRAAALELLVSLGRYVLDTKRCRVRVIFTSLGFTLDFQCPRPAAEEFASRMRQRGDPQVVIDNGVHPDLPPLPCARLWAL